MRLDRYDVFARLVPAILCLIPAVAFNYYFLNKIYGQLFAEIGAIKLISGLTFSCCIWLLAMYFSRLIGKVIESRMFGNGLRLPTTNLLVLDNGELSPQYKQKIYGKVKKQFDLDLSNNNTNSLQDRRFIHEVVGQIRSSLRDNEMVLQRNIHFGFIKNLVGGSIIVALPFCFLGLIGAISTKEASAQMLFSALLATYGLIAIFGKSIIMFIGKLYAQALFEEFMSKS